MFLVFVFLFCCQLGYAQSYNSLIVRYSVPGGTSTLYRDGEKISIEWYAKTGKIKEKHFYDGLDFYFVIYIEPKFGQKISKEVFFHNYTLVKEPLGEEYSIETFLGKQCRVYEIEQNLTTKGSTLNIVTKKYFWDGVFLRELSVSSRDGGEKFEIDVKAIDIQVDVSVPQEVFRMPDGINVISQKEARKIAKKEGKRLSGLWAAAFKGCSKWFPQVKKSGAAKEPMPKNTLMMIVGALLVFIVGVLIFLFK